MIHASLNLHSGGELITVDQLREYKAPPPSGRWFPLSHHSVYERVRDTLAAANYEVVTEQLAVHRDGKRFFGVLELKTPLATGVNLAVGVRNSVDKSFPIGLVGGHKIFVCSNLSFRGDLLNVRKRHTRWGEQRFSAAIAQAISSLDSFRQEEERRITVLQNTEITDVQAESLILRAWDRGIIGSHQLAAVLKEWREPSFEDFRERTGWGLLNAFTTVLTKRSVIQPQSFISATMSLHHLLDFRRGVVDAPPIAQAS